MFSKLQTTEINPKLLFDNYVTELKIKAVSYEYGDLDKKIIRDQVMLNVNNQALQERLVNITDLSLDKAVQTIKRTANVLMNM